MAVEERIVRDKKCSGLQLGESCERDVDLTFSASVQDMNCLASTRAADCTSLDTVSAAGLVGLTRTANTEVVGNSSCTSSSRFGPISSTNEATPVRLPPGRFRLATNPSATGSAPVTKTIGIVLVAAWAARTAGVLTTITLTLRSTRSAASAGNRSYRPSAQRYSIAMF